MRPPHRLCLARRQRDRRLDRRRLELLQLKLLLAFPFLAPPLHAGPRSRPRADVPQGGHAPRISARNQRARLLVSPADRLSQIRPWPPATSALRAGKRAARHRAVDVGPTADLSGGRRRGGARISRSLVFLVSAGAARPAIAASPVGR